MTGRMHDSPNNCASTAWSYSDRFLFELQSLGYSWGIMPECEQCGREETLPFTCAYCGGNYCVEHRLPESHNCTHRPKTPPPYLTAYDNRQLSEKPILKQKRFHLKKWAAIAVIAVIISVILWSAYPSLINLNQNPSVSPSPSPTAPVPTTTPRTTPTPSDSAPSETVNQELVEYALSLINSDRQDYGLQNVTLSSVDSGQRHAENLLEAKVLSHWDTDGYKPYMRYTLANGKGAVSENAAWAYNSGGIDPFEAIKQLEHDMMYDDASSNWGHRDNILNAFHNKVSIGIAYDHTNIYFVEDFEDNYVSWSTLTLSTQVVMQGTILKEDESISRVAIYFDNPTPLTTQQLDNPPYDSSYDSGTYVGMVVSPPPAGSHYLPPEEGILIVADTWSEAGQNFDIRFDMSDAFAQNGEGVYTLYLWTESNNQLTSLSIWNQ